MLVTSAWLRSDNQMRTRLSYISWLPGWHSEYEEQSRKTKSQDLTCPGPQSDQRIRSPVGNHDHWPVWPTHFTSTQWLQFLDIKQKSDKSARIFGDYSQDLNLSLSRLTKFQSCRLLSTTIHIREDINEKKHFFFGHCQNHVNPPPPDPNSDNLVLFFGRQNSRFESHLKWFAKMWGGEGDILTT